MAKRQTIGENPLDSLFEPAVSSNGNLWLFLMRKMHLLNKRQNLQKNNALQSKSL